MALIEVDVKLVCDECNSELQADLRGNVDRCSSCREVSYGEGKEDGYGKAIEELTCSECGKELKANPEGNVDPCSTCFQAEYKKGESCGYGKGVEDTNKCWEAED